MRVSRKMAQLAHGAAVVFVLLAGLLGAVAASRMATQYAGAGLPLLLACLYAVLIVAGIVAVNYVLVAVDNWLDRRGADAEPRRGGGTLAAASGRSHDSRFPPAESGS